MQTIALMWLEGSTHKKFTDSALAAEECCDKPCMCPQSLSHVQLFATPWTVAFLAPLLMEFSRQEYWSGFPFPTPGNLPDPGIELRSLVSPELTGEFFTNWATREAPHIKSYY